jgi:tRNA-2-methylthio-N6-dimethylallyladenosine synthase
MYENTKTLQVLIFLFRKAKLSVHMELSTKQYKYHITTFGCQMNKNDSERLSRVLEHMGLSSVAKPEQADVIMLNSCSVRESAESRIYGKVGVLAKMRRQNPELIIGVTGCMPGRDKDGAMKRRLKEVDLFFPIKDMTLLPTRLAEINPNLRVMEDMAEDYLRLRPNLQKIYQAFVTIQTGCNHFCTYCVVPYARGLEVNRSVKDIMDEVRDLAAHGCVEVTLLGQIVNHYIASDPDSFSSNNPFSKNDFAKLLWEINQVAGIERIHWTAPHPLYVDNELLEVIKLPKQLNFIHLPAQSGSNAVLKKMNRRHDRDYYIETVKKIRQACPEIAIGTDIIVGFCGETDEQFQDTVSLYQECQFDISYHAQYSTRSGTLATKIYTDDVPKEKKKERWRTLQNLMEDITYKKNQLYLGQTVSILVDEYKNGWCIGNTREMKRARVKAEEDMVGSIVEGKVFRAGTWMLFCKAKALTHRESNFGDNS